MHDHDAQGLPAPTEASLEGPGSADGPTLVVVRRPPVPVPPVPGHPVPAPPAPAPPAPAAAGPAPATPATPATERPRAVAHRLDVQGLRAVAVGLVVLYHLRPDRLPGGFIGVDVFFVISGFLIIGSLGREAVATGSIALRSFYARRIRRLLPASTVLLLAVMASTVLLVPMSRWSATALDVAASALQVQNWALAMSDSYAAATEAVSPLQHFWSLAVEEQFYLVTPLVLLGCVWVARRAGRSPRRAVVAGVATLLVLSFAHSVWLSATDHAVAYFATTTRVWELAAGGLLALLGTRLQLPRWVRAAGSWTGLAVLAGCALTYDTAMAFPGWVAAVPVAATLLVLAGGTRTPGEARAPLASRLLGSRVPRYVGDVSYSLYLWHWPVIVLFVYLAQRQPTTVDCALLLAGSLALAALSTRFVEEPFRHARPARRRAPGAPAGARVAFRLAAVLLTLSLGAAAGPWLYVQHRQAALGASELDAEHPGGATPLPDRLPRVGDVPVIPDPVVAMDDGPLVYEDGGDCGRFDPRTMAADACVYGDETSSTTVVLVGDSHAAQWSTALDRIASAQGWRLQTMVRNGCPFTTAPARSGASSDLDCPAANALTAQRIVSLQPRLVVVAAMRPEGYREALDWHWDSPQAQVEGYRAAWQPLLDAGIPVAVLADTPTPPFVAPECVEQHGPGARQCTAPREEVLDGLDDPLARAADGVAGAHLVDLGDHFCNAQDCPSVIGNVLVYRDNHMTDTFALSLVPALNEALAPLV